MANQVYDPETEGEQPTYRSPPDLGPAHNRPVGDSSGPRSKGSDKVSQSDLQQAEDSSGGFFNAEGDSRSLSSSAIAAAESGNSKGPGNFSYNPKDDTSGTFNKLKKATLQHKKGISIGVGAGGGLLAIVISIFFLLVPLKIEHIVTNLQSHFFSSSESAVDKQTDRLLGNYITSKVLPAYKSCGTTVSKNCTPSNFGDNPVGRLYKSWSNARLENKLAENYGIEFKYNGTSNEWYLRAPGSAPGGDSIGPDGSKLESDFNRADRAQMRSAIKNAMQDETRWKQVMYRYKVGRLLEGKYGIKRCIMFCGTKDALNDNLKAKKIAAQIYLTQRVITPRSESLGIVIECLLSGESCKPSVTQPTSIADENGAPIEAENPETDTKQRQALVALGETFPGTPAAKLVKNYEEISDKGFQKFLFEKLLTKLGLGSIASQAADAVPVVGAIVTAAGIISFVDNAGPAISKLSYITNSSAAASQYMMYRTYADEIHTGHVNATEVGSMTSSLGPGNHGPPSDPEKGGTASAEQTPLYQNLFGGSGAAKTALLDSALPSASAASNSSSEYLCENGKPVPSGKLVCSEEVLGQGNESLDSAHAFLSQPYIAPITSAAHAVSGITGAIGSLLGSVLSHFPGVKQVSELVSSVLQPFFKSIVDKLIPSPFSTNMSGGRNFDMMAAGADVSGNAYAQVGLGGKKLTPQQTADIINEQQNQDAQHFSSQSMFARVFNTNSQYSLVSKLAMEVPLGAQASAQSGVASLLNPLGTLSNSFGAMLSSKANAAATAQPDPFGVVQYGYTDGDIPNNPEKYWEGHCSDNAAQAYQNDADFKSAPGGQGWTGMAAASPPDDQTGMPVNNTTNPCLLIKASVGAAGGLFDTSNLTDYDLADQTSSSSTAPSAAAGDTLDRAHLYDSSVNVACAPHTKDLGIQDGYTEGKKVKIRICAVSNVPSTSSESNNQYGVSGGDGKLIVNSRISGVIYKMAEKAKADGVAVSADSGFRTMAHQECLYAHTCGSNPAAVPGTSNHQMGLAIDWGAPMYTWLAKGNGADFGFKALVDGEPWHWSPTGN
jgi:hypothetical protein